MKQHQNFITQIFNFSSSALSTFGLGGMPVLLACLLCDDAIFVQSAWTLNDIVA